MFVRSLPKITNFYYCCFVDCVTRSSYLARDQNYFSFHDLIERSEPSPAYLGTVYIDTVSFVTASVSMWSHLLFTRRRSSSLSEPGRFENAFRNGAFSK